MSLVGSSIAQGRSSQSSQGISLLRKGQKIPKDKPQYKIVRKIGEGAFGYGWLVQDLKNPTAHFFLKEMKWTTEDNVEWMEREAKNLAALKEVPYIPEMIFNFKRPFPSILQAFVEGTEQLGSHFENKKMSVPVAEKCIEKLNAILSNVHAKNIVHRDIKPDNILIMYDNDESFDLYLIDFGIGVEVNFVFAVTTPIGCRLFMHPLSFTGIVGPWADFYGVALTVMILMIAPENRLDVMCRAIVEENWPLGLLNHIPDGTPIKNKLRSMVLMNFDFPSGDSHLVKGGHDPKNPLEGFRSSYA